MKEPRKRVTSAGMGDALERLKRLERLRYQAGTMQKNYHRNSGGATTDDLFALWEAIAELADLIIGEMDIA